MTGTRPQVSFCTLLLCLFLIVLSIALSGCTAPQVSVSRYDVVDHTIYSSGPPSGAALAGHSLSELIPAPFPGQPIAGVSGGFFEGDLLVTVLDNGYGLRTNSVDFFPRIVWWRFEPIEKSLSVVRVAYLSDPDGYLNRSSQEVAKESSFRRLSGAEIDPESIAPGLDGTYWIGDEFGPYLFHFSAKGILLEPPVEIPIPAALLPYAGGVPIFASPDHQKAFDLYGMHQPNVARSKGIEGLSRIPGEEELVLLMEGPLLGQSDMRLVPLLSFQLRKRQFRLKALYPLSHPYDGTANVEQHKIGDLVALAQDCFLVLETDNGHGVLPDRTPQFKRIVRAVSDASNPQVEMHTATLVDLLKLPKNALGVESFPFVTIEGIAQRSAEQFVIFNDNNFPSSGGRTLSKVDRTEFLWLQIPRALQCSSHTPL